MESLENIPNLPKQEEKVIVERKHNSKINITQGNFESLESMENDSHLFSSSDDDNDTQKEENKMPVVREVVALDEFTHTSPDIEQFITDDEINVLNNEFPEIEEILKIVLEEYQSKIGSSIPKVDSSQLLEKLNNLGKTAEIQKEKLRLAKRALNVKTLQIEKLRSENSFVPLDMAGSRLHLAFMFSSPLIRKFNGKTENVMQLDCQSEIDGIIKVCSEMRYEMKYKSVVATPSNLRNVLTDRPVALHFSGHGIDNTPEYMGLRYRSGKDKGNILLFEDENSMVYHLFEQDLKDLIKTTQTQLEVVVVASCQSQFAGEVFLNAGAKHVVCIMQGQKIGDKSCLLFSKVFYQTLFVKNYNVCTSFQIAKDEVKKVIKEAEANKFILLIQDQDGDDDMYSCCQTSHVCQAITNIKPGDLLNLSPEPSILSIPSKPDFFFGRQQEMLIFIGINFNLSLKTKSSL